MNLYLIRHSLAESPSPNKSDSNRELTSEGKKLISAGCKFLKTIEPNLKLILSSPYQRAFQTAEIIFKYYDSEIKLIKENNLAAGCNTSSLIEVLEIYQEESIAVVGHQPDISNHISNFTSNANINLLISPAAIIKINFESKIGYGKGKIECLIQSEYFL